jgi:outer membrane protein
VARDVRVAWLDSQTAFQRLTLTDQLLSQANDSLDLAQQRYDLGLSSIVELTQAQLNQTRRKSSRQRLVTNIRLEVPPCDSSSVR